ncbi:DUF192 domain-containing protein [uncultured Thiothrix sp.]|uniref:DUF192 domain-containing protein n=1 Tax=uncultured Thiothrix sp. TaxID=223185 RepID=UPI0026212AC9|nr:DUF192 domain-containing protein [uncultured Thiothrix sp.]
MRLFGLLLSLSCCLAACNEQPNVNQQPQLLNFDHIVYLNDRPIKVAVFDTPAEREKGLMWVKELAKDHGALFVFEQEGEVGIWMKNTLIPLTIFFFDANYKKVRLVKAAKPCRSRCPIYKAKKVIYVLELNE